MKKQFLFIFWKKKKKKGKESSHKDTNKSRASMKTAKLLIKRQILRWVSSKRKELVENGRRKRVSLILTGIANGGSDGVTTLEEKLDEPRRDVTGSSGHAHHLPCCSSHVAHPWPVDPLLPLLSVSAAFRLCSAPSLLFRTASVNFVFVRLISCP